VGEIGKRTPVCLACGKRIRDEHPYVGVEELESGRELRYHARAECQMEGGQQMATMLERGKAYVVRHYHTCGDEENGFDCTCGCFTGEVVFGRN